jgi:DNA-directed RNA polymerase alpha subunit
MNAFHDFRIETDETGTCKRVIIDGVEQKGVIACDVRLRPDEIPTIRLEYHFTSIEAALSAGRIEAVKTFTDSVLDKGLEYLNLSVRAYNCLKRGVWDTWMNAEHNNTIADVMIAYRTGHLKQYKGLGNKTYREIIDKLKEYGLLEEDAE